MADLYLRDLNESSIREVKKLILESNREDLKQALKDGDDIVVGRHFELNKFEVD